MTYSVIQGAWTADGLWTSDVEVVTGGSLSSNYIMNADGQACARELLDGRVVKYEGAVPDDGVPIVLPEQAFLYWTVADAEAFERGEAVDPWLPKANMTK